MKLGKRLLAWSFALSLFCPFISGQQMPSSGEAAVPRLVKFSGKAVDAKGRAISGIAGITFAMYKQQEGGAPIWMETQNVAIDAGGSYSVLLGSMTGSGLPADLFSQQEERWLGVQVQGEPEQPRVLLVSVPYAFKAYEADKLAGHSASEFVTTDSLQTAVQQQLQQQAAGASSQSTPGSRPAIATSKRPLVPTDGATNFTDTTSNQVVNVTQNGSGHAIVATGNAYTLDVFSTASNGGSGAIRGYASAPSGFGVFGGATSTTGANYGVWGRSVSTSGTGVRALATATSGSTSGINATVASPAGTAGVFNNTAGGKILSGQNNGAEQFAVDGSGNVTAQGTVTADSGVSGTAFVGVFGQSNGSVAGANGVQGQTNGQGSGVVGFNSSSDPSSLGVYGQGGIGVFGTGAGWGMATDSNVQQARTAGGWVKAMVLVGGSHIVRCFNSTLAGAAASTPPCGFLYDKTGVGDYIVDFGFEVDDRFVSATGTSPFYFVAACLDTTGGCNNAVTPNQVEVTSFNTVDYSDNNIHVIVY